MGMIVNYLIRDFKLLGFSETEIAEIESSLKLSKADVMRKYLKQVQLIDCEDGYADQVCDLICDGKGKRSKISDILNVDVELTDADIKEMSLYKSSYADEDEMFENVCTTLQAIFENSSNNLCTAISEETLFAKTNNKPNITSDDDNEDVSNTYEKCFPIFGFMNRQDSSTFQKTAVYYIKADDTGQVGTLPGVFGMTDVIKDDSRWPMSMCFAPSEKQKFKNGDILVSRAFTVGNSNENANKDYSPLNFTTGNMDYLAVSARSGYGLRHNMLTVAEAYMINVPSLST